nr:PREDICTED: calcium-binding tyrosine phosphorylation-regulated protein [Balearica regulorum gibbericeps]
MQSSKIRLIVPRGLKSLLEGVSWAIMENNPDDIAEFFAISMSSSPFKKVWHPNLDITELVEKFEFVSENGNEGWEEKRTEYTETLFSGEPKQKDKCTDTEEDQLLEEPDVQYSSKGPEPVYVPAEPARLAAHVLAMASSEAGQPPPSSNVWTLYCLTDLRQGQKSPPSFPPAGASVPYSQATLSLSRGEDQQCGQLSQVSAPIYVMQEDRKRGNAPPFILVGSNIQNAQDWKPLPGPTVFAQQGAGARRRLTTVPVARSADEETDMASPNFHSAEETGAMPRTAPVFSVAIPLDDMMSAKKGSPAGDKHTGINALAESYGIAGQIPITAGPMPRAGP